MKKSPRKRHLSHNRRRKFQSYSARTLPAQKSSDMSRRSYLRLKLQLSQSKKKKREKSTNSKKSRRRSRLQRSKLHRRKKSQNSLSMWTIWQRKLKLSPEQPATMASKK